MARIHQSLHLVDSKVVQMDTKLGEIGEEQEPATLRCEVERATKKAKRYKAPGLDSIPIEMLAVAGEKGVTIIWGMETWPKDVHS